ncbi:MAG: hypothetical protein QOJ92_2845 [Frankiales bacterium]|nr:hypothetical protein [Frankiales bacterium]
MSATRCPSCAAAVRVDDPWCTLCYADLRTPEPVLEVPQPVLETVPASESLTPAYSSASPELVHVDPADPLGAGVPQAAAKQMSQGPAKPMPRWACAACGQQNSYDDLTCATCGKALLGDDGPDLPALVRPGSKASKVGVIFGGMVAVMAVLLLVFFVVGSFL